MTNLITSGFLAVGKFLPSSPDLPLSVRDGYFVRKTPWEPHHYYYTFSCNIFTIYYIHTILRFDRRNDDRSEKILVEKIYIIVSPECGCTRSPEPSGSPDPGAGVHRSEDLQQSGSRWRGPTTGQYPGHVTSAANQGPRCNSKLCASSELEPDSCREFTFEDGH